MNPANYNGNWPNEIWQLVKSWYECYGINLCLMISKDFSLRQNPYLVLLTGPKTCVTWNVLDVRGDPSPIFLLNGFNNKISINVLLLSSHVKESTLIREASHSSKIEISQRPSTGQHTENKRLRSAYPSQNIPITPLPQGLGSSTKTRQKECKSKKWCFPHLTEAHMNP